MSDDNRKPLFARLGESNYNSWFGDMRARLMTLKVWSLVKGEETQPPPADTKELRLWREKRDTAAGEIFLMLEPTQKVHINDIAENPILMWAKLAEVHVQKRPGTRFNAYDNLLSIRKNDDESLPGLVTRVEEAAYRIKDLQPLSFSTDDLLGELQCMAMIR
ncbi:hypothetical protein BJ138DRAFT_984732, partial [Hygrophoropsis aurantiaca]